MNDPLATKHIVFLPGLLCDLRLWKPQITGLEAAGYVCQMADLTKDDTIEAMAERVLEASPKRFMVIALSMGGYVVFEILRVAHERISRVILLDTSARPDTPHQTSIRQDLLQMTAGGRFPEVPKRLLPQFLGPRSQRPDLINAVKEMAWTVGPHAFERQIRAIIGRADSRPSLGDIRVPTLAIYGEDDVLTPVSLGEEIVSAIPGAEMRIIPGAGHLVTMEQPNIVASQILAWLTS